MQPRHAAVSIDLTRLLRRTVTSFYSNLVTRPTGRAVRLGVEQQLAELGGEGGPCLSILDFSQVRVLDYSCADEIVAKLLLRYARTDRPVDAYFLGRGLADHHREAIEAVLERHGLLLVAEESEGEARLLGPCGPLERACWSVLLRLRGVGPREVAEACGLPAEAVAPVLGRLAAGRVAVWRVDRALTPVPLLAHA